jgi:hypothetical protein
MHPRRVRRPSVPIPPARTTFVLTFTRSDAVPVASGCVLTGALRARNAGQLVNVHVMKSSRQRIPLIRPGDCAWNKMPNWPS